jgi:hypothetical protein
MEIETYYPFLNDHLVDVELFLSKNVISSSHLKLKSLVDISYQIVGEQQIFLKYIDYARLRNMAKKEIAPSPAPVPAPASEPAPAPAPECDYIMLARFLGADKNWVKLIKGKYPFKDMLIDTYY